MRLTHWGFAVAFLGLLASGLALGNPELRGIPFLGSKLVREIHLTWAALLFVLPAVAASWDGYQELRGVWREACSLDWRDWRWLMAVALRLLGRRASLPEQGRLNAGQKLNLLVVAALGAAQALTGVIIAPEAGRPVPQPVREVVYELHVLLAYCAVPVIAGHVFFAAVFPPTRAALRGIVLGTVRADWARDHHALWAAEAERAASSNC
jgi:formate dehydrogenase subunit gamma